MVIGQTQSVQIKGIREGLMVTIGEGEWQDVQTTLLTHIQEKAAFFKGARLALDVGNRILHAAEMGTLRDKLSDYEISLWAVLSNSPITEQTAQVLGLATRISAPRPERNIRPLESALEGEGAVFIQRTLRSGFRVVTKGHAVVVGDVNPGAEIIAGGSVVVWGRLRGTVHAGFEGNEQAVVCALDLSPMQMRIASFSATIPAKRKNINPEMARIQNSQVVIEPWKAKDK